MIRVLLFSSLLFLLACSHTNHESDHSIKGKFPGVTKGTVYLEKFASGSSLQVIDSAEINKDGTFGFSPLIDEVGFYRLKLSESSFITLILESGSRVTLEGELNDLSSLKISGSEDSKLLFEVQQFMDVSFRKIDSLGNVFQKAQENKNLKIDSVSQSLQAVYLVILKERENYVRSLIDRDSASFAALSVIKNLNQDADFAHYKKLRNGLLSKYPDSKSAKEFIDNVTRLERLAPGSPAPELVLNNPDGKPVHLSSLRGKYVLIDFWAGWCMPCRQENPNLLKVYNKYRSKGFEIYGVSFDRNMHDWMKATREDKLTWIQVSDLLYWNSPVTKLYEISGIPYSYLLDPDGMIIAKGLRGKLLEDKLEEIFKPL